MYLGDFAVGTTFDFCFTTRRFSTGATFTLAGTPSLAAYEDNSLTQITAGLTLTVDFDAITGLNHVRVVASGANGYEAGKSYSVTIAAGTVDSVSVVGEVVGYFTLERDATFARVGAPAGASIAADLVVIDDFVDNIESRLGTPSDLGGGATVAANLADIEGQTDDIGAAGAGLSAIPWNAAWDAEVESEVDDALGGGTGTALTAIPWNAAWDAEVESEVTDGLSAYDPPTRAELTSDINSLIAILDEAEILVRTTIATLASQTSFTLTAGSADNSAYVGAMAIITDVSTAAQKAVGLISAYTGATKTVTLKADPGIFTMAATDKITILAVPKSLPAGLADGAGGLPISDAGGLDLDTKLANTNEITAARMGALTDWIDGGRLDLIIDAILLDTAEIGAAGAGLTALATQASVNTIDDFLDTEIAAILTDTGTTLDDFVDDLEARLTQALADKLAAHALAVLTMTVDAGSSTTAVVFKTVNGTTPSATNDFYNGRVIVFTSGALAGQATSIDDYVGATKTATVPALTGTPAEDVTAVIV